MTSLSFLTPPRVLLSSPSSSSRPRLLRPLSSPLRPLLPRPLTATFSSNPYTISAFSPQTPSAAMRGAESDIMGLLLRERIVFLGTEITDFVADAIISQLLLLDAQDPTRDIKILVHSSGGSLSAAMAILDVVQLVRADVSTVALGVSASTASLILGSGTKGKRLSMPHARIMIHQPLGGASGSALALEVQAKEMRNSKANVIRLISSFTGRTLEQVEGDIDRDNYMSPVEAVNFGLIDEVIDRDSILPLQPIPKEVNPWYMQPMMKDYFKFTKPDVPDEDIQ